MRLKSVQKEDGRLEKASRGPGWHQSFANRRRETPSGIAQGTARLGRQQSTEPGSASVAAARSVGVLPGSTGEGKKGRPRAEVPVASNQPGF
jgi:hypothetical protein